MLRWRDERAPRKQSSAADFGAALRITAVPLIRKAESAGALQDATVTVMETIG